MTDLMTKEEMIDRLANGADPVELSIEKWKRVRAIHPAERISGTRLESNTCPLCYVSDGMCSVCKLREVTGVSCMSKKGNPWGDAVSDSYYQEDNGGVDRLIEMLEKCKEEKKEERPVDRAVSRLLGVHTKLILLAQNCEGISLNGASRLLREFAGEIELALQEMEED